jgi:hypothetical protein
MVEGTEDGTAPIPRQVDEERTPRTVRLRVAGGD